MQPVCLVFFIWVIMNFWKIILAYSKVKGKGLHFVNYAYALSYCVSDEKIDATEEATVNMQLFSLA